MNAPCSLATHRSSSIETSIVRGVDCQHKHHAHKTTSDRNPVVLQFNSTRTTWKGEGNLGLRRRVRCLICHKITEKEKCITVLCAQMSGYMCTGIKSNLGIFLILFFRGLNSRLPRRPRAQANSPPHCSFHNVPPISL